MISLIDTHAHIDLPAFDEDREAMLSRAHGAGVHAVIAIGHNPDRWRTTAELSLRHPFIVRTVGLHPNDAASWSDAIQEGLERELAGGAPVAVGETGLDFFRDAAPADLQREAFAAQLDLARRFDLPVVIHQRGAEQEVLDMVNQHRPIRGVMHCFSGDRTFAEACLDAGLMLGIGGVATYPKSEEIRQALGVVPLESLIIETDAPYLAPQQWRGKRNEPSFAIAAVDVLASIRELSTEEVAMQTTANAVRMFGERLEMARCRGAELVT